LRGSRCRNTSIGSKPYDQDLKTGGAHKTRARVPSPEGHDPHSWCRTGANIEAEGASLQGRRKTGLEPGSTQVLLALALLGLHQEALGGGTPRGQGWRAGEGLAPARTGGPPKPLRRASSSRRGDRRGDVIRGGICHEGNNLTPG